RRLCGLIAAGAALVACAGALAAGGGPAPAFAGKNGLIAFTSTESRRVSTVKPDGTGLTTLPKASDCLQYQDFSQAWSPDGRRLTFVETCGAGEQIGIENADGSGLRALTTDGGTPCPGCPGTLADNAAPSWSPDGAWIVFQREVRAEGGKYHIYRIRPDGTDLEQITHTTGNEYGPDWSPSGRRIAFTSDADGVRHVYTM